MNKSDITNFTDVLIQADLDFLLYQIKKREVTLIDGTGLHKLITDCQNYLSLPPNSEVSNTDIKPILVLYSLSNTLRILWMKRKEFAVQLKAMNSGTYRYGEVTSGEIYFKDFELELFTAAYLNEYGVSAELPQDTEGNDVIYKDIEIQCKHPEVFTREKIDGFLRDFQSSLHKKDKYGVFGIGVDDIIQFTDASFPVDYAGFETEYHSQLRHQDSILTNIFDDTLRFCPRVLGVYLLNTHFTYNDQMGLSLMKTSNSTFCLRPDAKEVPEEFHIQAYEVISVFNNKPAIRSYPKN